MKRCDLQPGERVQENTVGKAFGTVVEVFEHWEDGRKVEACRVRWDAFSHVGVVRDPARRLVRVTPRRNPRFKHLTALDASVVPGTPRMNPRVRKVVAQGWIS